MASLTNYVSRRASVILARRATGWPRAAAPGSAQVSDASASSGDSWAGVEVLVAPGASPLSSAAGCHSGPADTRGRGTLLGGAAGRLGPRGSSLLPPIAVPRDDRFRTMFIQTMQTPNPASLMFLPGQTVMESGSAEFVSMREAMKSPLATGLFKIEGVTAVFFGSDFVTVTKTEDSDWAEIKPHAFAAIMDHFSSGAPLINDGEVDENAIHDDDPEVVAMIKELLETRIRPAVAEDGGDIAFRSFDADTGIVTVKMKGSCSGCPSSSVTLKSGIENMLMHYIPEVKQVIEDEEPDEAESEGLSAFARLESKLSP